MRIVLLVVAVIVALLAVALLVFYVAGSRLPREHTSRVSLKLAAPRAAVWTAITDYPAMPEWWPAVKSVRTERRADGTELTWNANQHGREVAFRTAESKTNEKLVRVVVGDDLPFGGTWTFALADAVGGGTELTLTEDGFIQPPVFRAIATWCIGLDSNQRDFLKHLETRLATPAKS